MKEYVSVTARFDPDGNLLPVKLHWKDGRVFDIDRILDIRYAASLKAGHERYLFLEDNRWFVDGK